MGAKRIFPRRGAETAEGKEMIGKIPSLCGLASLREVKRKVIAPVPLMKSGNLPPHHREFIVFMFSSLKKS